MITALGTTKAGRPMVFLGLNREDAKTLLRDQPSIVDLESTHGIGEGPILVIFGGETDEAMRANLASRFDWFTPEGPSQ